MRFGDRWVARRSRLLQLWTVGVAASLAVTVASALGYLEPVQIRALDLLLWVRGQQLASDVVIVAIDDEAFEALGRRQPLPRAYVARLLRALERTGASVVGLDIDLTAATVPDEDAALAQAILDFGPPGFSRVVVGEATGAGSGPLAGPGALPGVVRGSYSIPRDSDGVIRRASFFIPERPGTVTPAFSLSVLARLGGMDAGLLDQAHRSPDGRLALPVWRASGRWDRSGALSPAIRTGELWRINFAGPAGSFLTVPSGALARLADPAVEVARDNPFRDRIVLVGGTFRESREFFPTPHGVLSGVEIHANLVHMLGTRSFIRASGWATGLALQLAVVLPAGVLLVMLSPLAGTVAAVAGAFLVGVPASYLAFHRWGYWVDFVIPAAVTCVMGLRAEVLARRRLRASLGRYVGREVMAEILTESPGLRGERRHVSILMSDLRGFTPLCEAMPAEGVAARLNEYFQAMTVALFAHRGTINDFVGDAIMAIFGAPLADPDHARHAVQSAVAMEEALGVLNRRWEAQGLPPLRMGIAIHSGEVFAGNVGGMERVKYAVVGDAVNATARLESMNKELGTTILITEETLALVGDRVEAKDFGEIRVRGRTRPLRVYELLALRADPGGRGP